MSQKSFTRHPYPHACRHLIRENTQAYVLSRPSESQAKTSTATMAELRQRPTQGVERARQGPERYERAPRPPPGRPMRQIHISITLLILACFILYASRLKSDKGPTKYELGGRPLPEYYGLCSRDGKKIYTVPEEGGLGEVECVVVGGKEVLDTGSLRQSTTGLRSTPNSELRLQPGSDVIGETRLPMELSRFHRTISERTGVWTSYTCLLDTP